MNLIVFVCTGNTCRSPMAKIIAENMIHSVAFESAGIFAKENGSMAKYSREALEQDNFLIGDFQSKRLHLDLIHQADLVLTMTTEQKDIIRSFFEDDSGKVYTLKEYTGSSEISADIQDPFGKNRQVYFETAAEIKKEIEKLSNILVKNYGIE